MQAQDCQGDQIDDDVIDHAELEVILQVVKGGILQIQPKDQGHAKRTQSDRANATDYVNTHDHQILLLARSDTL